MVRYIKNFKKVVWGFIEVKADNEKEAELKFDNADYDEIDNKSDYEFEEWERTDKQ